MHLSVCLLLTVAFCCARATPVPELTSDSNSEPSDPLGSLRHPQSALTRVVDESSVAELQEEAEANASSALSNVSFSDIENDNLTHSLQLRYRERKKQERITVIQAQILHRLRISRHPNITSPKFSENEQKKIALIVEKMHHINNNHDGNGPQQDSAQQAFSAQYQLPTMQRLQSFYPACSLPNHTDKNTWETEGSFRVFYDVPLRRHSLESEVSVMLAKLRLYKITGNADPNFVGWNPNQSAMARYNLLDSLINARAANAINVFIYQYVKPLRPNKKEKKRLVDTRTLPVEYEGWVEFNVITSLNFWLHHSNKNFGFDIEVEDAYGNKLNPNLYFQNMNCSAEVAAQDPPFPNIMELHPDMGDNETSLFFDNETFPTLDLQTVEISRDFPSFDLLAGHPDRVIRKRSPGRRQRPRCEAERIFVSFADMGLDEYILWPQGVHWTFCEGQCNSRNNTPSTESSDGHFVERWIRRFMGSIKKNPLNSHCTVTKREPLSVIYYDGENQVSSTVLENLVPSQCSCNST